VKVPEELASQWWEEAVEVRSEYWPTYVANRAAQWGWDQREHEVQEQADQELEAVEHWLITGPYGASIGASAPTLVGDLRAAMRPKPPSLAEQGLKALGSPVGPNHVLFLTAANQDDIRAALTRLAELEAQQ
jgi:hypothetical protein